MTSVLDLRSAMPAPRAALFDFHANPGAFERLAPPWETIRIAERTGSIRDGDRLVMRLRKGPLWLTWEARHFGFVEGKRFRDEQVRGPFAKWIHTHSFEDTASSGSVLHDRVEYTLPGGLIGAAIGGSLARRQLLRMFAFRHLRTACDLRRHDRFASYPRLTIAITGASGALGSALTPYLASAGHSIVRLVRREPREDPTIIGREAHWDPDAPGGGVIDQAAIDGCDAVIHLAGEPIAGRWTPEKMDAIEHSRASGTRVIAAAIARAERAQPRGRALLSASAVGYYGHRPGETLDESSSAGDDFRARVCVSWESATAEALAAGVRVALLRIGNVVGVKTPLLARLLGPWKLGLGGSFGDGAQGFPWIGLDDFVGAVEHTLHAEEVRGPVNLVAPQARTNREFARSLAHALRRPALGVYPAWLLRLAFGRIADEALLSDQRVAPCTLQSSGFEFLSPTLDEALRWEMGLVGEADLQALRP